MFALPSVISPSQQRTEFFYDSNCMHVKKCSAHPALLVSFTESNTLRVVCNVYPITGSKKHFQFIMHIMIIFVFVKRIII